MIRNIGRLSFLLSKLNLCEQIIIISHKTIRISEPYFLISIIKTIITKTQTINLGSTSL